jgi:ribosomal protein L11 methyltransferase (prmA)
VTRPDATGSRRADLAALCLGLLDAAEGADGLSAEEQDLAAAGTCPTEDVVAATRDLILAGGDPLGDAYREAVPPEGRRALGQTYTPASIIEAMTAWATDHGRPVRVVDPGCGSGRFTLAAATAFPGADVVACDVDPLATLMTRAGTHVMGLSERVEVVLGDYRELRLDAVGGPTLFIGNPPFVRHHGIAPRWKAWLTETARAQGLHPSALAGLHIHFFLATARLARPGDFGVFVTSSEWLDVQYGRMLRELLLGPFAAYSVHVLDPEAVPFADALVTGAITCFTVGEALPGSTAAAPLVGPACGRSYPAHAWLPPPSRTRAYAR